MRIEYDTNIKAKKIEADLRKGQTVAESSITELSEKNKILTNTKVCHLLGFFILSAHIFSSSLTLFQEGAEKSE